MSTTATVVERYSKKTNDDDVRDCAMAHKNISIGNFCDDNIIERLWFRIVFASKFCTLNSCHHINFMSKVAACFHERLAIGLSHERKFFTRRKRKRKKETNTYIRCLFGQRTTDQRERVNANKNSLLFSSSLWIWFLFHGV